MTCPNAHGRDRAVFHQLQQNARSCIQAGREGRRGRGNEVGEAQHCKSRKEKTLEVPAEKENISGPRNRAADVGEVTQATVAFQCSIAVSASVRMAPYRVAYREEAALPLFAVHTGAWPVARFAARAFGRVPGLSHRRRRRPLHRAASLPDKCRFYQNF
jgi:hypothetical protein